MGSQGGRLLTIREAADALGVSVETLRRWAESGRIKAERTAGGHRRFTPAEVQRVKGPQQMTLRPAAPPDGPLPLLGELLSSDAERLLDLAVRRLYPQQTDGWFAQNASRSPLNTWSDELVAGARTGQWAAVIGATRQMLGLAHLQGASLLERHGFLEAFGGSVLRELAASSPPPAELAGARRLFTALRHRLLHEEGARTATMASSDADALGELLAELLALPDLEWAAAYQSDPETLELELRAYAAPENTPPALPASFSLGSGSVGRVALSRRAAIEPAGAGLPHPMALAPMAIDGELAGVLALGLRRARPVGEYELLLLEALGGALARARHGGPRAGESLPRALGAFRAGWARPGFVSRAV